MTKVNCPSALGTHDKARFAVRVRSAQDALAGLDYSALIGVLSMHVRDRTDTDTALLQAFGNEMSRHADQVEREKR